LSATGTQTSDRVGRVCLSLEHKRRKVPATICLPLLFSQHRRALTSSPLSDYFGLSSRVAADLVDVSLILEGNLMNELTPGADKD
jgi:hypothetical protein